MRRGLLLCVGVGMLGLLAGCRQNCQGRCDCLVQPLEHGTPAPYVKPAPLAAPPLQPEAQPAMPITTP